MKTGNEVIKDFRPSFNGNFLTLKDDHVYYAGNKIDTLMRDETKQSKHIFSLISHGTIIGSIALKDDDRKRVNELLNPIEFTRVAGDVNGNSRYVCHFLAFINEGDKIKADTKGIKFVSEEYDIALLKAKQLGGRKFHNKQYGGGIVFQMYDSQQLEMSRKIHELSKVNCAFIQEWTPKQFKQVERAIYRHFIKYTYQWQPTHDKESRKEFNPFSYRDIDEKLGLAYTSTSAYAGYWVCNGGYMMANDTHHFHAFAINTVGKVIGIVQDENEKEIFIEL